MNKILVKKSTFVLIGLFALAGAIAVAGVAGIAIAGSGHSHSKHSERFVEHVAEKLSLNSSQEDQLKMILQKTKDKKQQLRGDAQLQIREIVLRDEISKEDALKILRLRKEKRDDMREFLAEQLVEFHAQLDSEQREKFAQAAPKILSKMDGRRRGHKRDRHHDDDDDRHGWWH